MKDTEARVVLVTGAAGILGRHVVDHLQGAGHQVVAVIGPADRPCTNVTTFAGDATDRELLQAATAHVAEQAQNRASVVVHLAAIPHPTHPSGLVFANNTTATFNVLEAAGEAAIGSAIIASSVAAIGLAFGRPRLLPTYLPLDEEHPILAEDPYALSKVVDECTAQMMHRRWNMNICAIRFPFIGHGKRLTDHLQEANEDPGALRPELWSYLHTDDAARAIRLATENPIDGFHTITIAASDTVSPLPTPVLLERYLPGVPIRSALTGHQTLLNLARAERLLNFKAQRTWRTTTPADGDPLTHRHP